MQTISADVAASIEQLKNKSSRHRRSAAKKLRKRPTPEATSALIEALEHEIRDPRTWETQYHMIMALAVASAIDALPLLQSIAAMELEHTMVLLAVGDAITRLEHAKDSDYPSLRAWIDADKKSLAEGGFRALAMMHLVPDQAMIDQIIAYAQCPDNTQLQFWVAAACPGWRGNNVSAFLEASLSHPLEDTQRAAKAALEHRYLKWRPL